MIQLFTEHLNLKTPEQDDYDSLRTYLLENRLFLEPWEPKREEVWYSASQIKTRITAQKASVEKGESVPYFIRKKTEHTIIGTVSLSNIIRGPFQSCFLGYGLNRTDCNSGYMTEAVRAVIDYAFSVLKLHRIEANIMPRNSGSRRVLEKTGFVSEGISRKYLKINGVWEDHEHFALLNDDIRTVFQLPPYVNIF